MMKLITSPPRPCTYSAAWLYSLSEISLFRPHFDLVLPFSNTPLKISGFNDFAFAISTWENRTAIGLSTPLCFARERFPASPLF